MISMNGSCKDQLPVYLKFQLQLGTSGKDQRVKQSEIESLSVILVYIRKTAFRNFVGVFLQHRICVINIQILALFM